METQSDLRLRRHSLFCDHATILRKLLLSLYCKYSKDKIPIGNYHSPDELSDHIEENVFAKLRTKLEKDQKIGKLGPHQFQEQINLQCRSAFGMVCHLSSLSDTKIYHLQI